MKRVIFAMAMMVTASLHAQILNVNNNDGTFLPLETKNIRDITFNEASRIVTLTAGNGEQHCFYTDKVESISPQTDNKTELTYNLEPTVVFDSNDSWNFKEITEEIPNDANDADYGDYVEKYTISTTVNITFKENDVTITFKENNVTVSGNIPYTKDGCHLTINSTSMNVGYIVSGECSNGSLKIYSDKKFQILLSGLELTNPGGPAINIQTGKTIYFTIDDDTSNSICDGATYNAPVIGSDGTEEDQKGTLFSEGQIIFNGYKTGTGTLNVTSLGGHGICSDDYIRIRSGNINIINAAKDGFHTNDKFIINRTADASPVITINATADGIDCGKGEVVIDAGRLEITTGGEAIKVEYEETEPDPLVTPNATINGGYIKFTTTGDKSSGIKTTGEYIQTDGIIHGTVKGNGSKILNCDSNITLKGGKLIGFAEGTVLNDTTSAGGIKGEGNINISNGIIAIECSGKGAKGINCNNVTITGGETTILTTGENFNGTDRTRRSIAIDTGNFTMTNGRTILSAYDNAIYATKASIFKGVLQATSNSNTAIDADVKQTGGWLLKKDAE